MENNNIMQMQNNAKYKSARISLLLIVLLSAANIFSMMFLESYFLFSAYFSQILLAIGIGIYAASEAMAFYIIFAFLALLSLVPYLLCYIFSKKKVGWMIAALVMFSVDSMIFLIDFVSLVAQGDVSYLVDLLIRIYALWSLAYAVKCGLALKNAPEAIVTAENTVPLTMGEGETLSAPAFDEAAAVTRVISVTRKKAFAGCAVPFFCLLDGVKVGELKNGATVDFPTDGRAHELGIISSNNLMASSVTVPAGETGKRYQFSVKMGMTTGKVIIEELPDQQ